MPTHAHNDQDAAETSEPALPPVRVLLGRGRSGTTWVGHVLNQYPEAIYKYEPFNPDKRNCYVRWLDDLYDSAQVSPEQCRASLLRCCQTCLHNVDYPPFPRKPSRRHPALLRAAWQLGKHIPAMRRVYESVGRADLSRCGFILIKQVNFPNELLDLFHIVVRPRIIALLRNPLASVASSRRFYQASGSSQWRDEARVRSLIELGHAPCLAPLVDTLGDLNDIEFEAITWVLQTEPLAEFAEAHSDVSIHLHERWIEDPVAAAREAYQFFGWRFSFEIESSVVRTVSASGTGSLHGVRKDPGSVVARWRRDLEHTEVEHVASIASRSAAFARYWPELAAEVTR